jgi:hypothetical protein
MPAFRSRKEEECESITELDLMLDEQIRRSLGLETNVPSTIDLSNKTIVDYRRYDFTVAPDVTYYQVRADKLGFRKGLSILDLLFNTGTEAPLILKQIQTEIFKND